MAWGGKWGGGTPDGTFPGSRIYLRNPSGKEQTESVQPITSVRTTLAQRH